MQLTVPTTAPFSFAQTLAFARRFPPCQDDFAITDDALTAAVVLDGTAVPFTLREHRGALVVETRARRHADAIVARAAHLVGATDDVAGFYAAARGDRPMQALIETLHGLHHVRFLTLAEIAVYAVMMQRAPVTIAAGLKRRFLARFGVPVVVGDRTLRAFPDLPALCALDADAIADAIGHRPKAEKIATVVRGVAAIGEHRLVTLPYAEARDALLAIPGIGPFSATAILLRGLGRMDELPVMEQFSDEAHAVYGAFDPDAIVRRYGRHIGYWSFYLKTGHSRASGAHPGRSGSGSRRELRANVGA
ncbi:MAG TPA: hypothetical protein VFQ53_07790 [Kofleriaceae bacterium]|nr:hypothetical protein [Kofleriaceae bacterium]